MSEGRDQSKAQLLWQGEFAKADKWQKQNAQAEGARLDRSPSSETERDVWLAALQNFQTYLDSSIPG